MAAMIHFSVSLVTASFCHGSGGRNSENQRWMSTSGRGSAQGPTKKPAQSSTLARLLYRRFTAAILPSAAAMLPRVSIMTPVLLAVRPDSRTRATPRRVGAVRREPAQSATDESARLWCRRRRQARRVERRRASANRRNREVETTGKSGTPYISSTIYYGTHPV